MKPIRISTVLLALLLLSALSTFAHVVVTSNHDDATQGQDTSDSGTSQSSAPIAGGGDYSLLPVDGGKVRFWSTGWSLSDNNGVRVNRANAEDVARFAETPGLGLEKEAEPLDGLRSDGTLTFTLTLSGPGLSVRLWDPLPSNVSYVEGSVTEPAAFDHAANAITWKGTLPTEAPLKIGFKVTPEITHATVVSLSAPIINTAWLTDTDNERTVAASVAVNAHRQNLPITLRSYSSDLAGWVVIMQDDFEGTWPGPWELSYNEGTEPYLWAKRDCRPYHGAYSAWAAGGNAGSELDCGANYPENLLTYMKYGPFSLADAAAAELTFNLWLQTVQFKDSMYWGASLDGDDFWGFFLSESTNGWVEHSLDLRNVPRLGNVMGQPEVWIVLAFVSELGGSMPEGAYVDDVVLRKTSSVPIEMMWQEFSFREVGTPARGCQPADPSGASCGYVPNAEFAGAPPWTFSASQEGAALRVVDGWNSGDVFEVYDFGNLIGETSASTGGAFCYDPNECWDNPAISSGEFPLAPGEHSITIVPSRSEYGFGAAFFRVD